MRYLVTGGTGLVGAHVVRELVDAGHQVTVVDLLPNHKFLADVLGGSVPDSVEVVSGDVADLPQLLRTMGPAKTERVVHLASTLLIGSEANPLRALKVNCEGTLNVFEAALALGVTKVVWASAVSVFPSTEDAAERVANDADHAAASVYAATKSFNERLGAHYQGSRGLDNVGLRFTKVYGYGYGETGDRAARGVAANDRVELLVKPALGQPGVIANGNEIVNWLYVEDGARAVRLATEAPPSPQPALTLCGDLRPMQEAVAYVRKLLPDADLRVETDRPGAVANFDSSVTEAAIGYRHQFSMEDGFRTTINLIRAKHGLPAV